MRILLSIIAFLVVAPPVWSVPLWKVEQPPPSGLLIVSERAGSQNIFLIKPDGSDAKNLTNDTSSNISPAWSPKSKKIVFASDRDGTMNIFVMDDDGSNLKQLTSKIGVCRTPSWSPDGKRIIFTRHVDNVGYRVCTMAADGSNLKIIGDGDGFEPAWSPDGKKILFNSPRKEAMRVYVMDADGTNVKCLTNSKTNGSYMFPLWSPDGKRIVYSDQTEKGLELFSADADGGNAKQLTSLGGYVCHPTWSSDGKRIAFLHSPDGGRGIIYSMDPDGKNLTTILEGERYVEGGRLAWR